MLRVRIKYKNNGYVRVIDNIVSITMINSLTQADIVRITSLKPNGDIDEDYISLSIWDITEISFNGIVNDEMEAEK